MKVHICCALPWLLLKKSVSANLQGMAAIEWVSICCYWTSVAELRQRWIRQQHMSVSKSQSLNHLPSSFLKSSSQHLSSTNRVCCFSPSPGTRRTSPKASCHRNQHLGIDSRNWHIHSINLPDKLPITSCGMPQQKFPVGLQQNFVILWHRVNNIVKPRWR